MAYVFIEQSIMLFCQKWVWEWIVIYCLCTDVSENPINFLCIIVFCTFCSLIKPDLLYIFPSKAASRIKKKSVGFWNGIFLSTCHLLFSKWFFTFQPKTWFKIVFNFTVHIFSKLALHVFFYLWCPEILLNFSIGHDLSDADVKNSICSNIYSFWCFIFRNTVLHWFIYFLCIK